MPNPFPCDMDEAMFDKILASVAKAMDQEAKSREAFIASDVFKGIVSKFASNPEPVQLDAEHLSYFPEKALALAGLSDYSKEQVLTFLSVMSSFLPAARDEGSVVVDDDEASFDNATFEAHGLVVSMVFGQGTSVTVRNKAFHEQRQIASSQ